MYFRSSWICKYTRSSAMGPFLGYYSKLPYIISSSKKEGFYVFAAWIDPHLSISNVKIYMLLYLRNYTL